MRDRWSRLGRVAVVLTAFILATATAEAQQARYAIEGTVVADGDRPVPFARVSVAGTTRGAVTDGDGRFRIGGLRAGEYTLRISRGGYRVRTVSIALRDADVSRSFTLAVEPIPVPGIDVSILRPDLQPATELAREEIREASPQDPGQLLRVIPGANAVRRGPLGLDPVVRGFRETQVGVYLDGTRVFPAGPARMDAALTHVDPSAIGSLEVVKGPYALTWGPGNLTAIRAATCPVSIGESPRATMPPSWT